MEREQIEQSLNKKFEETLRPGKKRKIVFWHDTEGQFADEVAGIHFKDKDGIQIMKDYMASASFARGKEEKNANASMVFVGNNNESLDFFIKNLPLVCSLPGRYGQ